MAERLIFEYTVSDYRGALRCHVDHDAVWRLVTFMGVGFVLLGAVQLYGDYGQAGAWAAVAYGASAVVYPQASVIWRAPLLFRQDRHLHGPITIEVESDRVRFRSALRDMTLYQVYKVVSTGQLMLLYDTRRTYMCLPRRVCASDAQFDRLLNVGRLLRATR